MRLLFKNGLKQLFKQKIQISIYVILIFISIFFVSFFGSSAISLNNVANETKNDVQNFNYSYRYTSSDYSSNDTATMSPWFAFDNELLHSDNPDLNSGITDFSTLTIGSKDSALKAYEFNNYTSKSYNDWAYSSPLFHDGNILCWVNFHFGDVESRLEGNTKTTIKYAPTEEQKVNNKDDEYKFNTFVSKAEFGDFYRFNTSSSAFSTSMIGKLYTKFNLLNLDYKDANSQQREVGKQIFNYMFYLNNSTITDVIKNYIVDYYNSIDSESSSIEDVKTSIEKYINGDSSDVDNTIATSDSLKTSLNGRIGWLFKTQDDDNKLKFSIVDPNDSSDNYIDKDTENDSELKNLSSYLVKGYEERDIFDTYDSVQTSNESYSLNGNNLSNGVLFSAYNELVGLLTNFKVTEVSQVVMWDSSGNKYKYISSFYSENENGVSKIKFYNQDLMNVSDLNTSDSVLTKGTFLSSVAYAQKNNLTIGSSYNIIPGSTDNDLTGNLRMDGKAVDSLNTYPTIYDEDILTDNSTQGIFYLHKDKFSELFDKQYDINEKTYTSSYIASSKYQDLSRVYLNYTGSSTKQMDIDQEEYKITLANNLSSLSKISDFLKTDYKNIDPNDKESYTSSAIKPRSDTTTINLKSSLLNSTAHTFLLISFIFIIIFCASIIFVVFNIVNKLLVNQKSQLGNLKALGIKKRTLIFNFISYMIVPIIPIVLVAWGISLACQNIMTDIFCSYFNMSDSLYISWKLMIVELFAAVFLIGVIVWFTTWLVVKKQPLLLLNKSEAKTQNTVILKIIPKKLSLSFIGKLRNIIIGSSIKDILTYMFVFVCSSFVLTLSSILPSTIQKMSKDYFTNINYNDSYQFNGVYSNNPLSQYNFYKLDNSNISDDQSTSSMLNSYFKTDNGYSSLFDYSDADKDYWTKNADNNFDSVLFNNLLTMRGINLSVGVMDKLVDIFNDLGEKSSKNLANTNFDELTSKVLPKLFNQQEIDTSGNQDFSMSNYEYCIRQIANNLIPTEVKKSWESTDDNIKNKYNIKDFSLEINNISYDENEDEIVTKYNSSVDGIKTMSDPKVIGVNKDDNQNINISNISNFLDDNNSSDVIPVTVSKKMELSGMKEGGVYSINVPDSKLYIGSGNDKVAIENDWWKYGDNNTSLWDVDLTHLTYLEQTGEDATPIFYKDANGDFKQYTSIQDIKLVIPKEVFQNNEKLQKNLSDITNSYVTDSGNTNVSFDKDKDFVVSPYDSRPYDDGEVETLNITTLENKLQNWFGEGIANNLISANDSYKTGIKKIKVVGVQNIYSGNSIFMSQSNANILYGVDSQYSNSSVSVNGKNINIWSNSKYTEDNDNSDQYKRMILKGDLSDNSVFNFSKTMSQAIGETESVNAVKSMIDTFVVSAYKIATVFIVISIVTAIIIIYLITDLFVGRYKTFMCFMRIQGYTMREINSIILWIFSPVTILSIGLGSVLVTIGLKFILPIVLIKLNIAVPLSFSLVAFFAVILACLLIFIVGYTFVIKSMSKIKLATLIGDL